MGTNPFEKPFSTTRPRGDGQYDPFALVGIGVKFLPVQNKERFKRRMTSSFITATKG
jgi:hypothetical protein